MPARILDLNVTVEPDPDAGTAGHDYGAFRAKARDFETSLQIELRTDALIAARKAVADETSSRTRWIFYLMATFEVTVEKTPADFDPAVLMAGDLGEVLPFFLAYVGALSEAEARFRQSLEALAVEKSVVRTAKTAPKQAGPMAE